MTTLTKSRFIPVAVFDIISSSVISDVSNSNSSTPSPSAISSGNITAPPFFCASICSTLRIARRLGKKIKMSDSGTFDDDYTRTTSSIDKEWSYVSWDASRTYMTEQTSGTDSESWKTSFRWQKDIPCVKITENEDGGMMYFYLDRIHGSWCSVSMDWSSRFNSSKTTYDRDWDGKIHSHTVTASGTGTSTSAYKDDEDGGSVNIYLTY